jgi:hypothetical protein
VYVSTSSNEPPDPRPPAADPVPRPSRRVFTRSTSWGSSPSTRTPTTSRKAPSSAARTCTPHISSNGQEHTTRAPRQIQRHHRNGPGNQPSRSTEGTGPPQRQTGSRPHQNQLDAAKYGQPTRPPAFTQSARQHAIIPRLLATHSRCRGSAGSAHPPGDATFHNLVAVRLPSTCVPRSADSASRSFFRRPTSSQIPQISSATYVRLVGRADAGKRSRSPRMRPRSDTAPEAPSPSPGPSPASPEHTQPPPGRRNTTPSTLLATHISDRPTYATPERTLIQRPYP